MDSSAARLVQQRYTAGGCALDITLQPSALSQWYPRPIAQALTFKLWLGAAEEEGEAQKPTLIAEGDRETLQAIADYIAHQTRAALTLAALSHSPTSLRLPPVPCPPSFQPQSPLSYLQLCDLTAVLNQYEQAIYLLPVSLSPSVVSTVPPTVPPTVASSRPRGRLIAFPAHRKLWASSAAAALLAVGLTTALLTRTEQNTAVVSDSSPVDSNLSRAESSPPESAAPRSEDATPLESAPVAPKPTAENAPSATPTPSANTSANRQTAPSLDASEPSSKRPVSPRVTADEAISPEPPSPQVATAETQREAQRETLSETQPAAPNTANGSADVRPLTLPSPSAARQSAAADLQTETLDIIVQVQNYFQAQWQTSDQTVQLPVSYQLQISKSGEIISLVGLSDAAREYRDRLLPADPPAFSYSADEPLTLRLTLTADGLVQVTAP